MSSINIIFLKKDWIVLYFLSYTPMICDTICSINLLIGGVMNIQRLIMVFVIVVGAGICQTSTLATVWQNPRPQGNKYGDLCVINENIVFMVDEEGGTILKTTDGGLTWNISYTPHPDTYPGYYELHAIDFPDSMTGYAAGLLHATNYSTFTWPIVLKTTNQGATWQFLSFPAFPTFYGGAIKDIEFPHGNNQIGYAVGGFEGYIYKTTDGGQSWNAQTSGVNYWIHEVHFPVDANTGFGVGGNNMNTPVLIKTTNGGTTWVSMTSPASVTYWDVSFVDNQTGYAGGYALPSGGYGTIIKTTNGGNSWQIIWQETYKEIYAVHFLNSQVGYAGGWAAGNGFIMKTTNGGNSWTTVNIPKYIASGMKIAFANSQKGFAFGNVYRAGVDLSVILGQILKTDDAGATWNFLNTGPEVDFTAVDFPENDMVGYVVGNSGSIFKTTNGGVNWIQQSSGTDVDFLDVDFLNNQIGFAVGTNGSFSKTTNGGNTWIPKNTNTTAKLFAVKFVNEQIGYIGGRILAIEGGVIYKTTDGGDNWILQTLPNNESWRAIQDIFFFNADTGYAVAGAPEEYGGVVGVVYKTTNGGQNWTVNYMPSLNCNFYSIDFPENSQIGYISGCIYSSGYYKIIKTTNGGNSWFLQGLWDPSFAPAISVDFVNNNTGYAVGRGGYHLMMKTTNGGTNWFPINLTTLHHCNDVFAVNANIVYAAGRGGMIRKTTNGGSVWIAEKEKDESLEVENANGLLVVYPNPFRKSLIIRYTIQDTGEMIQDTRYRSGVVSSQYPVASIKIYDVSGRLVKSFNLESCIMNHESAILWFGDDDSGRRLPSGVYFVRLETDEFKKNEKVILLK